MGVFVWVTVLFMRVVLFKGFYNNRGEGRDFSGKGKGGGGVFYKHKHGGTGYQITKRVGPPSEDQGGDTRDAIIIRYAEVLLNYAMESRRSAKPNT